MVLEAIADSFAHSLRSLVLLLRKSVPRAWRQLRTTGCLFACNLHPLAGGCRA